MCLAVPLKIKNIEGEFALVESSGLKRRVNIQMVPQARPGDFVLVHAGFAIQKVDPEKARQTLRLLSSLHK